MDGPQKLEKDKYHMISLYMWNLKKKTATPYPQLTDTENRLVVTRRTVRNGYFFFFSQSKLNKLQKIKKLRSG